MTSTAPPSSLLQSPLALPLGTLFLVIFAALLIISISYFLLSYVATTSTDYEDFVAGKEEEAVVRRAFSIVAAVSFMGLLGLIIGGVVLRSGEGSNGDEFGGDPSTPISFFSPSSTSPSGFIAQVGKKYSGKELIKLYENLPQNSLIHCNLEVVGKFEECTVFFKYISSSNQTFPLNSIVEKEITNNLHVVQRFKDNTKNTTIITTRNANTNYHGSLVSSFPESQFSESLIKTKIARNKIYQLVSTVDDCKVLEFGSQDENSTLTLVNHLTVTDNDAPHIFLSYRRIKCTGLNNASAKQANLAEMYKAILNYPAFKMSVITNDKGMNIDTPDPRIEPSNELALLNAAIGDIERLVPKPKHSSTV